MALKFIFNTN